MWHLRVALRLRKRNHDVAEGGTKHYEFDACDKHVHLVYTLDFAFSLLFCVVIIVFIDGNDIPLKDWCL